MRSSKPSGAFTVSGPFEADHPVPNVGAGISCAQTFASRHRDKEGELTYYVRDLSGLSLLATVTREEDGSITTRAHSVLLPGRSK